MTLQDDVQQFQTPAGEPIHARQIAQIRAAGWQALVLERWTDSYGELKITDQLQVEAWRDESATAASGAAGAAGGEKIILRFRQEAELKQQAAEHGLPQAVVQAIIDAVDREIAIGQQRKISVVRFPDGMRLIQILSGRFSVTYVPAADFQGLMVKLKEQLTRYGIEGGDQRRCIDQTYRYFWQVHRGAMLYPEQVIASVLELHGLTHADSAEAIVACLTQAMPALVDELVGRFADQMCQDTGT